MESFDVVVVGAGSGLTVANAAANQDRSVAVVEKGPMGGTCLNRGCIPSKELVYHADVLRSVRQAGRFHIDATVESVDVPRIVEETNRRVAEEARAIREGLEGSSRHEVFQGEARFVGDRCLEVALEEGGTARVEGEAVVIAAGSRPRVPPLEGLQEGDALTSRGALRLEEPPDRLVIVGGGYIAAELGHFFGTLGSEVTVIGRRARLLPEADEEVGAAFTERFRERFTVRTGYEATSIQRANGELRVHAEAYADPGREDVTVAGDELLLAAGRCPNTDALEVEKAGVETDARGFVVTDEHLETTAPGVWALGDIVGEHLLKHNANQEASLVAHNLLSDHEHAVDYSAMPFAVFSDPEVAGVGEREQDLRERGRTFAVSRHAFEDTARGKAMKARGFVKVLADPEGSILGCHIVGPHASVLIQEAVNAMRAKTGVRGVREPVHIHPALPEVVQRAFYGPFQEP